jgi:drug/metabolite transporter (DMT)-like permease
MSPLRGIILMISAISFFAIMGSLIKAADRIPAGEAVFFRSFAAMPVIIVWLLLRGSFPSDLRTSNWRSHAVRGVAGSCAMGLGFVGLRLLPLPEVTAIRFATPILLVIFAALILGEKVRLVRLSAVAVGLVGVMIVMWPRLNFSGGDAALIGALVTLGSAGLAALAQVFIKLMSSTERTAAIVFYFSLTATCLSLLTIPFGWVMPAGREWVWLIGAGVLGGIGQILLTASYRFTEAGVLAPFTYVSMIWALILGYFVFNEVPTLPMLGGAGLVIAAGVAIVLRERHLGLEQTALGKVRAQG